MRSSSKVVLDVNGRGIEAEEIERYEDENYIYTRYRIPSWKLTSGKIYETDIYIEPKGVGNTSGIESWTGMPRDYSGKLLKDFMWDSYPGFDTQKQQNIVNDFIFNLDIMLRENVGLYLSSKTRGSGKSFLACCIGNEIIRRRGLNVKFVSVPAYIQAYKDKDSFKFSDATVLILDDIGVQDDSKDWISEIVYGLINYRYEHRKLTLFTSNMPISKCAKDERIVSRVEDMAVEVPIPEVPVRSRRSQLRKEALFESLQIPPF